MADARDVACTTKRQYATRNQAKQALKILRRQGRRDLLIYECWYCELFHLGHPPGKQTYTHPGDPPLVPRVPTQTTRTVARSGEDQEIPDRDDD